MKLIKILVSWQYRAAIKLYKYQNYGKQCKNLFFEEVKSVHHIRQNFGHLLKNARFRSKIQKNSPKALRKVRPPRPHKNCASEVLSNMEISNSVKT